MSSFFGLFATELVVAMLGAFSVYLYRFVRAYLINRKFLLSARYISRFCDRDGEREFIQKSTARVRQSGRDFFAIDQVDDGAAWTLKGEIYDGRRVCGVYGADADHDHGVGTFYFDLKSPDLIGIWAGFDNVNGDINSGTYSLTKMATADIKPLKERDYTMALTVAREAEVSHLLLGDYPSAMSISADALGSDYVTTSSFDISYGKPILLGASLENRIFGFSINYLLDRRRLREIVLEGRSVSTIPPELLQADEKGVIGVIKTIAVDKNFQGRGIGTQLIREAEKRLKKLGAQIIVVPAWERNDAIISIGGVLDHLGYTIWGRKDLFWKTECDAGAFQCPARRNNECSCNMVFFSKHL